MKVCVVIPVVSLRTVARYFFLAVGIACLGICGYAYVERVVYQTYESWEFDRTPRQGVAAAGASKRPASTELIGRLSIPRLQLSVMVREGIGRHTLQLAVGHIPGTALPGQSGNVGVAGHRDTFFRGLKDLQIRDEIRFSTLTGDFQYVVESLLIVGPDDIGVLAPSDGNVLTLVTCYPFFYVGTAPRRFIVRARQMSPQTVSRSIVE